MKQKIKLDPFEKEIEAHVDQFVPITGEKRRRIEAINERSRKTKNINIRITEDDLAHLKRKAEEEGIPYQTLISSVLHKYITDRLVDERKYSSQYNSWENTKVLSKALPGFTRHALCAPPTEIDANLWAQAKEKSTPERKFLPRQKKAQSKGRFINLPVAYFG